MKKLLLALVALFLMSLPATVSADDPSNHRWSHQAYHHNNWHKTSHTSVNFNWHERRDRYSARDYRMERIHDRGWHDRFPGLRAYRWVDRHGAGFWYHGHRVTNAVFFYDNNDELVSIGFMHNGAFIFIRDDHNSYENHDSFFLSWWSHN